jgi:plasmid replication initiation protein
MPLIQPKINMDAELDAWSFESTNEINKLEERLNALLSAMENLANGSTTDQVRDAIINALSN